MSFFVCAAAATGLASPHALCLACPLRGRYRIMQRTFLAANGQSKRRKLRGKRRWRHKKAQNAVKTAVQSAPRAS